jgi:hypothetical protein
LGIHDLRLQPTVRRQLLVGPHAVAIHAQLKLAPAFVARQLQQSKLIGVIGIYRQEVCPFMIGFLSSVSQA